MNKVSKRLITRCVYCVCDSVAAVAQFSLSNREISMAKNGKIRFMTLIAHSLSISLSPFLPFSGEMAEQQQHRQQWQLQQHGKIVRLHTTRDAT